MNILDLKTIQSDKTIKIDDVEYEIINFRELGLKGYQTIINKGDKFYAMMKELGDKKDVDGDELEALLDEITRSVIPTVPDEVYKKLTGMQKMEIIKLFPKLAKGLGDTSQEATG